MVILSINEREMIVMNIVEVNGGNKTQREICHKVISHILSVLLPRYRTLDITVKIKEVTW